MTKNVGFVIFNDFSYNLFFWNLVLDNVFCRDTGAIDGEKAFHVLPFACFLSSERDSLFVYARYLLIQADVAWRDVRAEGVLEF